MANQCILHFKKPGLQTLVQDHGRLGYQNLGVPINGVLDKKAASIANWLVGNPQDSPVLEITLLGPQIVFEGKAHIAISGADLSAKVNGEPIPLNTLLEAPSGATLSFGFPKAGCRAYLAIAGDWQVQAWLDSDSASAILPEQLTPDSVIRKDSTLVIQTIEPSSSQELPTNHPPVIDTTSPIRLLPGPEFDRFSNLFVGHFFSQEHKIGADSNRMGYRLQSNLPKEEKLEPLISSPVIPGTIQVPAASQPILLLADAQTTGGYPRFATVITADLDRLAQFKPGDQIRFVLVDHAAAREALLASNSSSPF